MKKIILGLILICAFACKPTNNLKATTDATEIKEIVTYLASDELKGRNTGTQGIHLAANYITAKLQDYGVKPYFKTYRDTFQAKGLESFNIVGYLEGSDAKLKEEVIIIGAHYDHIGKGKTVATDSIANGANDNAAGTSAVLALAKYFAVNKNHKRSLIFALFSAEEMGLLGSNDLAEKLKAQHINLYTMVNFEMIGVPFKDRDYTAFLTGFDLSNMATKMNEYLGSNFIGSSEVAKKYNLFKMSDNYAFYKAFNLPSHTISSCDLSNYDYYHHVDDEADKLDYKHMESFINTLIPAIEKMSNTPTKEIKMYD